MAEVLTGVNGDIIRWARELYNLSIEEAASSLDVNVDRYIMWEKGEEYPTYAKLKNISSVFHKPSAIFFFPMPPQLPDLKGELRTLPTAVVNSFSKNIIVQFEKAKVYQMNLQELYGIKPSLLSDLGIIPKDIVECSKFIREQLDFPIIAQKQRKSDKVVFEIFREKLYECGIYVFKDSFKDTTVSGLCINDRHFPVIVINNGMSFARQNFTLFHELYHLISDTNGVEIIRDDFYSFLDKTQKNSEKMCDAFANEFLVPLYDFKIELGKSSIDEYKIDDLSKLYSVSKEAIMYKLYSMNKITSEHYTSLKENFYGEALRNQDKNKENKKSGGSYYNTKLSYLGTRYTTEVFQQHFKGNIDRNRTSEMLGTKSDHLSKLETAFFRGAK